MISKNMKNLILCPNENCINIPRINLLNDSQNIRVRCNEHGKLNQTIEISDFLSDNDKMNKKFICSKCKIFLQENDCFSYCNKCKTFFCSRCNKKEMFHDHRLVEGNFLNFWKKCLMHNNYNYYTKYCKTCNISLCENCHLNLHSNHIIVNKRN